MPLTIEQCAYAHALLRWLHDKDVRDVMVEGADGWEELAVRVAGTIRDRSGRKHLICVTAWTWAEAVTDACWQRMVALGVVKPRR